MAWACRHDRRVFRREADGQCVLCAPAVSNTPGATAVPPPEHVCERCGNSNTWCALACPSFCQEDIAWKKQAGSNVKTLVLCCRCIFKAAPYKAIGVLEPASRYRQAVTARGLTCDCLLRVEENTGGGRAKQNKEKD